MYLIFAYVRMCILGPVYSEIADHLLRNPNLPVAPEGGKMETQRFAQLAAIGIRHRFDEMIISKHPFLLITYMSIYMPWVYRQINVWLVGGLRTRAIEEGRDLYDIKSLLGWSDSKSKGKK